MKAGQLNDGWNFLKPNALKGKWIVAVMASALAAFPCSRASAQVPPVVWAGQITDGFYSTNYGTAGPARYYRLRNY